MQVGDLQEENRASGVGWGKRIGDRLFAMSSSLKQIHSEDTNYLPSSL